MYCKSSTSCLPDSRPPHFSNCMRFAYFSCRQQISTSVSSETESSRQQRSSGLLPKLSVSAEGEQDDSTSSGGPREDQEKSAFVSDEIVQDEPEVTTPASTISSSTLSGNWQGVSWLMILQTVADHLLPAVALVDVEDMYFRTGFKNSCRSRDLVWDQA